VRDAGQVGCVRFSDWTKHRAVATLGSNQGSTTLAFQNWRRFKEAFAPELVARAVDETAGRVAHVTDPFGGSGTTALAAQFLGVHSTTIEVNPFLEDLIESKLAKYDFDRVVSGFRKVVTYAHDVWVNPENLLAKCPRTFVEPGVDGRFIFSLSVAARLCAYRQAIEPIDDLNVRRLFNVILAGIVVPVSNIVVSGKGRRYRKRWAERTVDRNEVDRLFGESALGAIFDLRRFEARPCRSYTLHRGDARELVTDLESVDLAVFSPPYPNSFDYTDVYNVELWALGYLNSADDNRSLREATLRSHVQIGRDLSYEDHGSRTLRAALGDLGLVRERLWDRNIPDMIGAYFSDMHRVLAGLRNALRSGGRIYIVVGDSRYAGVDIPVGNILCELTEGLGLNPIRIEPFRSMRASPQQGGRRELAESLLVFER
jgi:DNA modification methylase